MSSASKRANTALTMLPIHRDHEKQEQNAQGFVLQHQAVAGKLLLVDGS